LRKRGKPIFREEKYKPIKISKMVEWIIKNKSFLSIRAIEQHLGIPDSTLSKAVNGSQKFPKKWEKPLKNFINELQK
jgi:hypothetical protein